MARLALISLVLCCFAVAVAATSCSAQTDINFYFADILAGANSGSGSGSSGSGNGDSNDESEAAYAVTQTINSFFDLNTFASNDPPANVVYSKYASLLTPFTSASVVLSTSSSIINGGVATSYNGVSGVVDYLRAVADARNSSYQQLSNLVFDFSEDLTTVTVNAVFSGLESLNSNFSFETFFGDRTYQLVADASKEYGYAISSVNIIRSVTRPSPAFTATFRGAAQQAVLEFFTINDRASNDNNGNVNLANYGDSIAPLVTDDLVITSVSPLTGNKTYSSGVQAYVNYLSDVSSARLASQQEISSFQFAFNYDQSSVVVNTKFSGWEQLSNGSSDTFFGTRTYNVVRGDDGAWRIQSVVIVRSATFSASRSS